MSLEINRIKYANMYGPTSGDKVRLGDTELFIEIEKDFTVYGAAIIVSRVCTMIMAELPTQPMRYI